MKRLLKSLMLTVLLIFSFSMVSVFATTNQSSDMLNAYIKDELEAFIQENNLDIELSNINFSLKKPLNKIELEKNIDTIKESLLVSKKRQTIINEFELQPYILNRGSYYISQVWCGVPGVGYGHINQDFSAKISNGKITNIRLLGASYKTGYTIARWSPNRSWTILSKNNTHLSIYMKGVLNYTFNIFDGGMSATFRENIKVSNGKLVSCYSC